MVDYTASMGVYCFAPRALAYIDPGERLDLPDLVLRLIAANEVVRAWPSEDYWLDIGRHEDYEQAQEEFAAVRDRLIPPPSELSAGSAGVRERRSGGLHPISTDASSMVELSGSAMAPGRLLGTGESPRRLEVPTLAEGVHRRIPGAARHWPSARRESGHARRCRRAAPERRNGSSAAQPARATGRSRSR